MPKKIKKQARSQGARSRPAVKMRSIFTRRQNFNFDNALLYARSLAHIPKYLVLSALALGVVLGGLLVSDLFFESGITGQQFQTCGPNSCSACPGSQCAPKGCIWNPFEFTCTQDTTPPSQTTGVSANSITSSSLALNWNAATDNVRIKEYKIFRALGPACGISGYFFAGTNTTPTGFSDSGLARKTTYCYYVSAYDPAGNAGQNSSSLVTATIGAAPSAPQNLASAATATQVSLSWSAPADNGGDAIQCYKIFRSTIQGGPYSIISSQGAGACNAPSLGFPGDPTATSYDDSTVSIGTTYYYAAKAINTNGPSIDSNEAGATPSTTTSSSTTTTPSSCNPSASQCSACATQIACADPCSWNIHSSVCAAPTTSSSTTTSAGTTSSTTTTAPPDTTPPAKVSGLNTTAGNSQVLLNWTANTEVDLSNYRIYQNNIKIATVPVGGKPPSHPTFYTVTGLTNGVEYTFQVSAADASGNEGLKSDSKKSTPTPAGIADTTPPTILSTSPTNQTMNTSKTSEITITFSESMKQTETEEAISVSPDFAFTKSWSGNVLTLTPTFDYNIVYEVTIGTGAQDLSGNALASAYRFLFATAPAPTTTIPATTAPTTTTTTPPPAIVSVATTSGAQQEALSAILEANKTIYENQGKKDVVGALKLYSDSIKAYNVAEYISAKNLALQSKSAIKEFTTATTKPSAAGPDVVWISVGVVLLVLIAGAAIFIYMQNKKAAEKGDGKKEGPKETPEAPKEKTEIPIVPATPTTSKRLR